MSQADDSALDYAAVTVQMRPSRVAVVVPLLDEWPQLSEAVLRQCAALWGGAGFILIPHRQGEVSPLWRRVAIAYDPDHVVRAELPLADLMDIAPLRFPVTVDGGAWTSEQVRATEPELTHRLSDHDAAAQNELASVCTPFFDELGEDAETEEPRDRLTHAHLGRGRGLASVQVHGKDALAIEFAPGASALASVWLRSVKGVVWPLDSADLPSEDPATDDLRRLVAGQVLAEPEKIDWYGSPGWAASLTGIVPLVHMDAPESSWVVVGSTFEDFALAHALARMNHYSVWLPDEWLDGSSPWASVARSILSREHTRMRRTGGKARVTSTSLATEDALARCEACKPYLTDDTDWIVSVSIDDVPADFGRLLLALGEDYDKPSALPVRRSDIGNRTLATPLPPLLPDTPGVPSGSNPWVTDVRFEGSTLPPGRGFPGRDFQAGDDVWWEHVRSSRDGISFMAGSNGFVSAGSNARQTAARPQLIAPSLQSWVESIARRFGHVAATSEAGHTAAVATSLWLSRRALADDLAGSRPIFATFLSTTTDHKVRYPNADGYLLGKDGYPTFEALVSAGRACGLDGAATRAHVDRLLVSGAVRRGLILRCTRCSKEQFSMSRGPGDVVTCVRCSRTFSMVRETWSGLHEEPQWYYDLDPTVRALIAEGGDVPLLAERWIARTVRGLQGVAEFDVRWSDGTKSEIDLLCTAGGEVVVGECKATPEIKAHEQRKKITSLLRIATLLGATEIVLASGEPGTWSSILVDRLNEAVTARPWPSGRSPRVRILSGLRTDSVADSRSSR